MTKLKGKVTRETSLTVDGRTLVVELEEPGNVVFKLKGTREKWQASAVLLRQIVIQRHVEEQLAQKRRGKRRVA